MKPAHIFVILLSMILGLGIFIHFLTEAVAPSVQDSAVSAYDLTRPRAPSDAKEIKNPLPASKEIIANGKEIYHGKGNCYVCHGAEGKGDGEAGVMLNPPPRDFTDPRFHQLRTDGELFWAIKYGVPETGMFSFTARLISEEEAWMVVHYIRTLARPAES